MTKLHELAGLGQAIWIDYIRRAFIESGDMAELVKQGVRGMTSNPSIFDKAIAGSNDYDSAISELAAQGKTVLDIYENLAIEDIQAATELLRPLYEQTGGSDGFVSLEVNPHLARDTQATIAEARRLWERVDRPNLMIKIPATREGLPAIRASIAGGINVNVTLIFALDRYQAVMDAFLSGLEDRLARGEAIDGIHSVASFFISRLDTKVDKRLDALIHLEDHRAALATETLGAAAIANARLAYELFLENFESNRFENLKKRGANLQRPLWASTSTKNPAYSDIRYVQELIGPDTVNTLPQRTLEAFLDHGEVRQTILNDLKGAHRTMENLENLGISMAQVTLELENEGVDAFAKSFNSLLESIAEKRAKLATDRITYWWLDAGQHNLIADGLERLKAEDILARIWEQDFTVWSEDPREISNRLGWLHIADEMRRHLPQIEALVYAVQQAGYDRAVLLGMGGSSLAPELFGRTFAIPDGYLKLEILDSTDPGAVLKLDKVLDLDKTLFIVSTKSGGTVETLSFFKHFYHRTVEAFGLEHAGDHFIAITDPGSKLVDIAGENHFRATFLNDPNIGGRYSALSYFGIIPAALAGVDLDRLLGSALDMARQTGPDIPLENNPAARLGTAMGVLALAGRDKLTIFSAPEIASFGDWVEQLIAESTGKIGKGILPVTGESVGEPAFYGADRFFVEVAIPGGDSESVAVDALADAGHPLVRMQIKDRYALGGLFLLWELATAVAGYFLGINPFDQPNVESAKVIARQMVAAYQKDGALPHEAPALVDGDVSVFAGDVADSAAGSLKHFLASANPGDYVAIQAFVTPDEKTAVALHALRQAIRDRYKLATTVGFGPRFLHSTGQLHKGDRGNGLFIQFTSNNARDLAIPSNPTSDDSDISFGILVHAQALGDRRALMENGRRVIRFNIASDVAGEVEKLSRGLG